MHWKLKVSGYGKIKNAEIETAPLTLFVGDNNSGKSYLMSLLWLIQNFGVLGLFLDEYKTVTKSVRVVKDWLKMQMEIACKEKVHKVSASEIAMDLQAILQDMMNHNKNCFISLIFNSQDVKIKGLEIELVGLEEVFLSFERNEGKDSLTIRSNIEGTQRCYCSLSEVKASDSASDLSFIGMLFRLVTGIGISHVYGNSNVFLPASRTGFMLTNDIISKAGRNAAFNEVFLGIEQEKLAPFTRPINQFLDVMNDLSFHSKGRKEFDGIVKYLENGMAEGTIEMSTLPNKEVSYVPSGLESGIPFRAASAVVTELSPLILILKHHKNLKSLFYEEPEMCLHPQLQQKMGRVICQLVNAGVNMTVTTHSDIILQHINNMISLSRREDAAEICQNLKYIPNDLLKAEQIKVYQLKCGPDGMTEVEELKCGKNGFAIPTFNDALDSIIEEAYTIQE